MLPRHELYQATSSAPYPLSLEAPDLPRRVPLQHRAAAGFQSCPWLSGFCSEGPTTKVAQPCPSGFSGAPVPEGPPLRSLSAGRKEKSMSPVPASSGYGVVKVNKYSALTLGALILVCVCWGGAGKQAN